MATHPNAILPESAARARRRAAKRPTFPKPRGKSPRDADDNECTWDAESGGWLDARGLPHVVQRNRRRREAEQLRVAYITDGTEQQQLTRRRKSEQAKQQREEEKRLAALRKQERRECLAAWWQREKERRRVEEQDAVQCEGTTFYRTGRGERCRLLSCHPL